MVVLAAVAYLVFANRTGPSPGGAVGGLGSGLTEAMRGLPADRREGLEELARARAKSPRALAARIAATGAAPPLSPPDLSVGSGCPRAAGEPGSIPPMSPLGCQLIASDTATGSDPIPFWGSIDCADASRYSWLASKGDNHLTAAGELPGRAYRRLTVEDGDDFYGERCELGENYREGPTAFYREGDHLLTYFSERLPRNFPIDTQAWQTVMQMKQAEPEHDGDAGVALQLQVMDGRWFVLDFPHIVWSFPARTGVWTRFAWNVVYSRNPAEGSVQVFADLNDDGDFDDPGERSRVFHGATLATEEPAFAAGDGLTAGGGITSHLRVGIYHDPAISCRPPVECSVDVANVQVLSQPE